MAFFWELASCGRERGRFHGPLPACLQWAYISVHMGLLGAWIWMGQTQNESGSSVPEPRLGPEAKGLDPQPMQNIAGSLGRHFSCLLLTQEAPPWPSQLKHKSFISCWKCRVWGGGSQRRESRALESQLWKMSVTRGLHFLFGNILKKTV